MEVRKQYTIINNDEEITITVGDYLRVKTKEENIIGKVSDLGSNYVELEISEHNRNVYKSFLYVSLLEVEIYEDEGEIG